MSLVTDLEQLQVPVEHDPNTDHEEVTQRLLSEFEKYEGYGLSANQIGVQNSRTCLVDVQEKVVLVNPRIVNREGTTHTTEGCLSIPNAEVRTERNLWIEVEADRWFRESVGEWNEIGGRLDLGPDRWSDRKEQDEHLKQSDFRYLESIATQHEIDHLNGKTIYDREVKNQPFEKDELDKLGRNDKVYVENGEGEEFEVKWKYAKKHDDWTVLEIKE